MYLRDPLNRFVSPKRIRRQNIFLSKNVFFRSQKKIVSNFHQLFFGVRGGGELADFPPQSGVALNQGFKERNSEINEISKKWPHANRKMLHIEFQNCSIDPKYFFLTSWVLVYYGENTNGAIAKLCRVHNKNLIKICIIFPISAPTSARSIENSITL